MKSKIERNQSIDGLKYLLIAFVVLGHSIEPSRYTNGISTSLYSVIYSFHMPLFIFLSGYFYKIRYLKEEWAKCLPLIETCLVCHVAFHLITNGNINPVTFIAFGDPSWYLLSLVCWRLVSAIFLSKYSVHVIFIFAIIIELLSFLLFPVYGTTLSVMRTLQFYPYFLIGYILQEKLALLNSYKFLISALGICSLGVILLTSNRFQHVILFQRDGLYTLEKMSEMNYLITFVYRYVILFASLSISALILLLSSKIDTIKKVSKYGQSTLFIYFGQTLLYPIANRQFPNFYLSVLVSFVVLIVLTYLSTKSGSRILMNPISTLIAKCKTSKE